MVWQGKQHSMEMKEEEEGWVSLFSSHLFLFILSIAHSYRSSSVYRSIIYPTFVCMCVEKGIG